MTETAQYTFTDFVLASFSGLIGSFHSLPVSYWMQMVRIQGHEPIVINLESMEEDLRNTGLEISVPHLNSSSNTSIKVTADLKRIINCWASNDMDKFNPHRREKDTH